MSTPYETINARRIKGGAIVTVTRADGGNHRYRVGLRRFRVLSAVLAVHDGVSSVIFTHNGFDCRLRNVSGMAETLRWVKRNAPRLLRIKGVQA